MVRTTRSDFVLIKRATTILTSSVPYSILLTFNRRDEMMDTEFELGHFTQEVKKVVYVRKGELSKYCRWDGVLPPRNEFEAVRRGLHLTQESFGNKLGISKSLVNQYESGRSSPTVRTWLKMKENAERNGIELTNELYYSFVKNKSERMIKSIDTQLEQIRNEHG